MFMLWFFIALLGYVLLAIAFILDKFILTESVDNPVVYTFYSTIVMFGAVLLFPFMGFQWLNGVNWLWAILSGVSFGFGLLMLYKALQKGESSHIQPFNGAIITITTFTIASYTLGETLTLAQKIGVGILIISSLLLSFEKSRKHNGFHIGFVWAAISGVLFGVSHLSAKYLYTIYDFWPAFTWTRATTGLVGLLCLAYPSVRNTFKKGKQKNEKKQTSAKKYAVPIIMVNKIFAMGAVVIIQYAAAIGSVTLVFALSGLQYALMFAIIIVLSKWFKSLFNEYFTKRELVIETIAIILVIIGSALFVF